MEQLKFVVWEITVADGSNPESWKIMSAYDDVHLALKDRSMLEGCNNKSGVSYEVVVE